MNKVVNYVAIICIASFVLNGCASIGNGKSQQVQITTPNVRNATCTLTNSQGSWVLHNPPGIIDVKHAKDPLIIKCSEDGYVTAKQSVPSHISGFMVGNVLLGGVVGAVVDSSDNAAYSYPFDITVTMHRATQKTKHTKNMKSTL